MKRKLTRDLSGNAAQLRSLLWAAGIGLALLLPFVIGSYQLFQMTMVVIYAIALLGLNILIGYSGQISVGHGAFYAVGAYVAAVAIGAGLPYWLALPLAGLVSLVVGFLFGLPALRLTGLYLALATFALGAALPQLLKFRDLEPWTGGAHGIALAPITAPAGLPLSSEQWLYLLSLGIALALFWFAANLLRGRIGRALMAIRDQPVAAATMGINTGLLKASAFAISAMYTGIAGALGALVVQFVAPESFTIFLSISFLVGVIVGGVATLPGALFGALFIQFVPNFASAVSEGAAWAIYGIVLILVTFFAPRGIAGALATLGRKIRPGAKNAHAS